MSRDLLLSMALTFAILTVPAALLVGCPNPFGGGSCGGDASDAEIRSGTYEPADNGRWPNRRRSGRYANAKWVSFDVDKSNRSVTIRYETQEGRSVVENWAITNLKMVASSVSPDMTPSPPADAGMTDDDAGADGGSSDGGTTADGGSWVGDAGADTAPADTEHGPDGDTRARGDTSDATAGEGTDQ